MPTHPTPKNPRSRARASAAAKRRQAKLKRDAAKLLAQRKARFVESLEASHLVTEAAKAAGVHRSTAYEWRDGDEAFAQAWSDTEERSTELLEREAYRRAAVGTERPVFQGGLEVGRVKEYSDTLLIFLLKARRPDTYRDQHKVEHSGPGGGPVAAEITGVGAKEVADAAHQFLARLAGPSA